MGELLAFLVVLAILAVALALVWFGCWLERDELTVDREQITQQRQALDAEWQALGNARRINDVFFAARRAMQDEMRRQEQAKPQFNSGRRDR